jgi:hypothetical protein
MGESFFFCLYEARKYLLTSWYCHSEILTHGLLFLLESLAITCTAAGHGGIYIELRRETSLSPSSLSQQGIRAGSIDSYVWPCMLRTPRCTRQKSEKRVARRGAQSIESRTAAFSALMSTRSDVHHQFPSFEVQYNTLCSHHTDKSHSFLLHSVAF